MPIWLAALNPRLIGAAVAFLAFLGVCGYAYVETQRHAATKREYASFKALVQANGEIAEARARAQENADLAVKVRIDNENKTLRGNLAVESERMRLSNINRSTVSALPASTVRPDIAAFDRAELDRAVRDYQSAILGIVTEGAAAVIDLDTGKNWIREQSGVRP